MRLDVALVDRGLVASRTKAARHIQSGAVTVDGQVVRRPSQDVGATADIRLDADDDVSRGATKLRGALAHLDVRPIEGATCLDAGSSTGGFTQVLLERGATRVIGIDVGHGQMPTHLRSDPRVDQRDGVNLRDLKPGDVPPADLIVADVSFISLTYLMAPLAAVLAPGGQILALVKPQFEVGRVRGGVVTDPGLHSKAIEVVVHAAQTAGLAPLDLCRSPITGTHGNQEFFLLAGHGDPPPDFATRAATVVVPTKG